MKFGLVIAESFSFSNSVAKQGSSTFKTTISQLGDVAKELKDGTITKEQFAAEATNVLLPTTGVARDIYKFFTGAPPTDEGMAYLIDSEENPTDLTDFFYEQFSVENRFISFAVNLGVVGEGKAAFAADYGSLSFSEAVSKAYGQIIGFDAAAAKGVAVEEALRYIESQKDYFETFPGGDIGAKAAMVGYVLSVGHKYAVGNYYEDLKDHVVDQLAAGLKASGSMPTPEWDFI